MQFSFLEIITLVGAVLAAISWTEARIRSVHARIDKVKDDYVRREDFNAQIKRIETSITEIKIDIRDQTRSMNSRLDLVLSSVNNLLAKSTRMEEGR